MTGEILLKILECFKNNCDVVLAVLIKSSGSTPRKAGAVFLADKTGRVAGTIGGGISEYLAAEEAKRLIVKKESVLKNYVLRGGVKEDIGGQCGGETLVYLLFLSANDKKTESVFSAALDALNGADSITRFLAIEIKEGLSPANVFITSEKDAGGAFFYLPLTGSGVVYIFGSGHVARALLPVLTELDFNCALYDDRSIEADDKDFPRRAKIINAPYSDISAHIHITENDYIIALTRSHELDFTVSLFALQTRARYIGIIGSRKKLNFVKERLVAAGIKAEDFNAPRVHAPVGLDISSETPKEIAISIAGELIKARAASSKPHAASCGARLVPRFPQITVLIKGAGDIASAIALRLYNAGFKIIMTEIESPNAIRRGVSFCEAVFTGSAVVEGVEAKLALDGEDAKRISAQGYIALLIDGRCECLSVIKPDVLVDAIIAKRNTGTKISGAGIVVAAGPGFTAGRDCHAVVETMRGHTLGRVYYEGGAQKSALPNTGVPGGIGGFTNERVHYCPAAGMFSVKKDIGSLVEKGDVIAEVIDGDVIASVCAGIGGVVRGILRDGKLVERGLKCADIDPRGERGNCFTVSDKALAVAGGVLEAVLRLSG